MRSGICQNCNSDGLHCECYEFNPTPTDKSPPLEFWIPKNYECDFRSGIHVIEHSAYLSVKQELDAANYNLNEQEFQTLTWKASYEELKKELDAARAEIERLQSRRNHEFCEAQLVDAKAQIADYEAALEEIAKSNFGSTGNVLAQQALNKWRAN